MRMEDDVKIEQVAAAARNKKTWKLHQTIDELQTWSAYLQQSAERFIEELEKFGSRTVFVTMTETNAYKDSLASLEILKKESSLLKNRSRRLHGRRR